MPVPVSSASTCVRVLVRSMTADVKVEGFLVPVEFLRGIDVTWSAEVAKMGRSDVDFLCMVVDFLGFGEGGSESWHSMGGCGKHGRLRE